jgi:hypothetical protein
MGLKVTKNKIWGGQILGIDFLVFFVEKQQQKVLRIT